MLVINKVNTSEDKCKCNSWLEHWEKYNQLRQKVDKCSVQNCNNDAEVGGHVIVSKGLVDTSNDKKIIPLCKNCNNQRGEFLEIYDDISFSDIDNTCER